MNLQQLNDAQYAAATAPLQPTLVLAGAGSGKTRVLTNRILYLVQQCHVLPSEILAITFTNKAANEMKRRLYQFDCQAEYMHVSTIHSFCATVLRREAQSAGRQSNFSIYTEDEKKSLVKKIVKDVCDDGDGKIVDGFCDSISEIKNNAPDLMGDLESHVNNDEYLNLQMDKLEQVTEIEDTDKLVSVIKQYVSRMAENNALDFDDLLYYVHKLFADFPEILDKYRERYKYILIDEFQDTNKVQYNVFKMLGSKYRNIFVVGDDDQSIYSWRGADAMNLQKFKADFPDANVYKLEQNYRSTKRILDVANGIIEKNGGRFSKVLWTQNEDGIKPQLFSAYSEQDEAYFVTKQIQGIMELSRNSRFKDFAVLMRVNALSRAFEAEFQRNRIPYKIFGGFKFFERKEIKDILAYFRLVSNTADNEAFFRAINVPVKRGVGDTSLKKLAELSADYGLSAYELTGDERNLERFNSTMRAKLADFHNLISKLIEISRNRTVQGFTHDALEILQFREAYVQQGEEERALNVDNFEESVNEFQQTSPTANLQDYLQTVSLYSDLDESDESDYVTIATIHAVKGLEFKNVFVVGLEDGIFPSGRSTYDSSRLAEERRLMYVAVTRAEKRLYLTRANSRFMWGQRKSQIASKYFNEVSKMLTPPRQPATERQLADDRFLDRLNRSEPTMPKAAPKPSAERTTSYRVGQIVNHDAFGEGIILKLDGAVAQIAFKSAGKKTLNVNFAPMSPAKK